MTTWNIDPTHSSVSFTVRHTMFAKVRGIFGKWTGTLQYDPEDLAGSKVEARIETASIDTKEANRDNHLRSPDFFDSAKFPELSFQSRRITAAGKDKLAVQGDLTIHGVTKPVVLDVELLGSGKDPWGNERAGFLGKTRIDRTEFGLTWTQALETGGVLVSKEVDIELDIQAVKAK